MPGGYFFATGASAPTNANDSYEDLGFGTDGSCSLLTAAASANTKGTYVTLGTTTNDWRGFWLEIGNSTATATRYLVDIRAGGVTIILPDFFIEAAFGNSRLWVPLAVATGTLLEARIQSNTASAILNVAVSGRIKSASHPPMFTTCTALNVDAAATRASTTAVALTASLGSYTQIIASTGPHSAILVVACETTTPATTQQGTLLIAKGAAASEVLIGKQIMKLTNTGALLGRCYKLYEQGIAGATRLAAACLAPTPGADTIRVGIYGFA